MGEGVESGEGQIARSPVLRFFGRGVSVPCMQDDYEEYSSRALRAKRGNDAYPTIPTALARQRAKAVRKQSPT